MKDKMPNNRPERHHIVPQVYLRNFSDSNNQILEANLIAQKVSPTNIINASVGNDFYTITLKDQTTGKYIPPAEFEKWLDKTIESPVKDVFNKIIKENVWPLNYEDRRTLTQFVTVQYLRGQRSTRFHYEA